MYMLAQTAACDTDSIQQTAMNMPRGPGTSLLLPARLQSLAWQTRKHENLSTFLPDY